MAVAPVAEEAAQLVLLAAEGQGLGCRNWVFQLECDVFVLVVLDLFYCISNKAG